MNDKLKNTMMGEKVHRLATLLIAAIITLATGFISWSAITLHQATINLKELSVQVENNTDRQREGEKRVKERLDRLENKIDNIYKRGYNDV